MLYGRTCFVLLPFFILFVSVHFSPLFRILNDTNRFHSYAKCAECLTTHTQDLWIILENFAVTWTLFLTFCYCLIRHLHTVLAFVIVIAIVSWLFFFSSTLLFSVVVSVSSLLHLQV